MFEVLKWLVAFIIAFFGFAFITNKIRSQKKRVPTNLKNYTTIEKFVFRAMLFVLLSLFLLLMFWGIRQAESKKTSVNQSYENVPWKQTFELSRDSLEVLRNGEFAEKNLDTSGVVINEFGEYENTKYLPKKEIAALNFLHNNSDLPVNFRGVVSGRNHFHAVLKRNGDVYIYFEYTQDEPFYQTPHIIEDIGYGYYLVIIPTDYYYHRHQSMPIIDITDIFDYVLFLICTFLILFSIFGIIRFYRSI